MATTEENVLNNIFIGEVPVALNQKKLFKYFSKFGQVATVRLVPVDREEYQSAFINFRQAEAASRVLWKKFHLLNGFSLRVCPGDSWNQSKKSRACSGLLINSSNIFVLNDDCLEVICSSLKLRDQVRFAFACERFREIFTIFSKRQYKTLQLSSMLKMTLSEYRDFFRLAGEYIERIIGNIPFEERERIIQFIAKYCPNVKGICMHDSSVPTKDFMEFMLSLANLEELTWRDRFFDDENTKSLLHLKKLRTLALCDAYNATGKYISRMVTVRELNLFGCKHLETTNLIDICKSLKDLTLLDIRRCMYLTEIFYNNLNVYSKNLEVLKMSYPNVRFGRVALLPKLKQFELLDYVPTGILNDDIFIALVEHKANQLEILKIVAKNSLTSNHMTLIAQLKKLKILFVANNNAVTDDALSKFHNLQQLEELTIKGCVNVTSKGLLKLLINCKKLHYINIQFCKNITCEFIKEAIYVLKEEKYKRKMPLELLVYGSSINNFVLSLCQEYQDIKEESLFEIVFHNLNPFLGLDDGVDVYDTWDGDGWMDEEDDRLSIADDEFYFPESELDDDDIHYVG